MIKGICKNKTLENFPVKIFKNTAKLTKIPTVFVKGLLTYNQLVSKFKLSHVLINLDVLL